jgi:hypothetical protein
MDVLLTSFGMGMKERGSRSIFHRMPPLFTGNQSGRFHIDYAALFMFDRVIVDDRSYEKALNPDIGIDDTEGMSPSLLEAVRKGAEEYAEVLSSLHRSGRIVTKNFDEIYARSKPLLEQTTSADLRDPYRWRGSVEAAVGEWTQLREQISKRIRQVRDDEHGVERSSEIGSLAVTAHSLSRYAGIAHQLLCVLKQWKKKQSPEMREMCRDLLKDYLYYTNFNLILSFDCQAPFIDWTDMRYFYEEKFKRASLGKTSGYSYKVATESRQLFDFLFPYFVPRTAKELLRAVDDSRTDRLRDFVKVAVDKGTRFDSRECICLLKDILRLEQQAIFRRKITGWVTLPAGFIPVVGTPFQKGLEELVNSLWSNRPTREYSWFYLINELNISEDRQELQQEQRAEQVNRPVRNKTCS